MSLPYYKILFTRRFRKCRGFGTAPSGDRRNPCPWIVSGPKGAIIARRRDVSCCIMIKTFLEFSEWRIGMSAVSTHDFKAMSGKTAVWNFLLSRKRAGYFNFEFNCGGALLASYVTDPTRVMGSLKEFIPLTPDDDRQIRRYASLPSVVEPEIVHTDGLESGIFSPLCRAGKVHRVDRPPSKDRSGGPIFINAVMKPPTPTGFPGRRFPPVIFMIRQASAKSSFAFQGDLSPERLKFL